MGDENEICNVFEIQEGEEVKKTIDEKIKPLRGINVCVENGRFDYPYDYDYEVKLKNDNPKPPLIIPPQFNGYCYYCDYARHSQNYCPLKLCYKCGEYGHSIKVCKKNRMKYLQNWRSTLSSTGSTLSSTGSTLSSTPLSRQ